MAITNAQIFAAQQRAATRQRHAAQVAPLRPLRNQVNQLLKAAGAQRAKYSKGTGSRVRGMGARCLTTGWVTELYPDCVRVSVDTRFTWSQVPTIRGEIEKEAETVCVLIRQALAAAPGLEVRESNYGSPVFEVRAVKG
jgi:hypothetical protein